MAATTFGTMGNPGDLYTARPGKPIVQLAQLPQGVQQLSVTWPSEGQPALWTLTEHPDRRQNWTVPIDDWCDRPRPGTSMSQLVALAATATLRP